MEYRLTKAIRKKNLSDDTDYYDLFYTGINGLGDITLNIQVSTFSVKNILVIGSKSQIMGLW
jgi:hypothetical protein